MIRLLIFFIIITSLSSCYTTQYFVNTKYKLAEVNSYGNEDIVGHTDNDTYVDEYVGIAPIVDDALISLIIRNHHNSSIKILWDDASYVDYTGEAHRIIHEGINPTNKETSHIPTTIPAGSYIEDTVAPIDCITFNKDSWVVTPINDYDNYKFKDRLRAEELVQECKDNSHLFQSKLLLPFEIDGKKVEYTLKFIGDEFYVDSEVVKDSDTATIVVSLSTLGVVLIALIFLL
ncbi:MAG: hypothetical protein J6Q21_00290 [Alistipes sp.]|nr:hypothetical protein [Alistipes sp.]